MSQKIGTNKLFLKLKALESADNQKITQNIQNDLFIVSSKLLERVPQYMPEYTAHDIDHCLNVLNIIDDILPQEVELNIVELQILVYAVLLHDIGMVINTDEAQALKESAEFSKITKEFGNQVSDDEILTELIRRTHVQRSLEYIDRFKNDFAIYKIDFSYNGIDISQQIKNVIESHELPASVLVDKAKYPINELIDSYTVNIQFLSILLRLGDILDFDITRTPYFLYKDIGIKNKISQLEWQKHQAIQGRTYSPEEVRFVARPHSIQVHRKIEEFVEWIEVERKESLKLLDANDKKYFLKLSKEINIEIKPQGYIYNKLEINLDYEKVLNILMGTELYDNVDVFLRELLQNSYDACKYKRELFEREPNDFEIYDPKIIINYDTVNRTLEILDNGIGIDEETFRNYVITIGKSYYKSKYFAREHTVFQPISNFGIGIISCFMVSDTIEIESLKEGSDPIHYVMNINDKYIEEFEATRRNHGTRIKLKLHSNYLEKLESKSIEQIINTNMSYHPIPIYLRESGKEEIVFNSQKIEAPEHYRLMNGFILIELDESDELEGFILIHKRGGHHNFLEQSRLSQQNFVITNKNNQIPLQPLWIQNIRYNVNIPDSHKLHLKASRNNVHEDESLRFIKEKISQKIVDYFMENHDIYNNDYNALIEYIDDGRHNIIRFQYEYEFLTNIKMFQVLHFQASENSENIGFLTEYLSFREFVEKIDTDQTIKVAVVKLAYFNNPQNLGILAPYFRNENYKYIILDNVISTQYFHQFVEPLCEENIVQISENLHGLVYHSMKINKNIEISVNSYKKEYSWQETNNIDKRYFAVVSNSHYNGFNITLINKNHQLGKLMSENQSKYYIEGFKNSIINNYSKVYINGLSELSLFEWDEKENFFFNQINNLEAYAAKFQKCLTKAFLDSLNQILGEKVLGKLVEEKVIESSDVTNYLLKKEDFPSWYFKDE